MCEKGVGLGMTDRCGSHSCGLCQATAGCFRRFRKKRLAVFAQDNFLFVSERPGKRGEMEEEGGKKKKKSKLHEPTLCENQLIKSCEFCNKGGIENVCFLFKIKNFFTIVIWRLSGISGGGLTDMGTSVGFGRGWGVVGRGGNPQHQHFSHPIYSNANTMCGSQTQ